MDWRPLVVQLEAIAARDGLTDAQTARLLGVPVYTWRKWRKLEREPSSASVQLIRIVLLLDTVYPDLLDGVREW
jgi:DNA-binding transcriptional regulator YiaG